MFEMLAAAVAPTYPIQQYLQVRSASAGTFTPDGRGIVFSTNITGVSQLWRVPSEGGWPEQLTFYDDSVRWASRAPRGNWLLFGKDHGGDERAQLYLLSPDGTRTVALTNDPKTIHTFGGWSPDGKRICYASNARNSAFFDLYVMDVASHKATRVLQQDGTNYAAGFSPDGRSIVFSRVDTPSNQNLYLLDLASKQSRLLTPHKGDANYNNVTFGRDGRLYMATDEGREFSGLASLDVRGGKLAYQMGDAGDVEGLAFDERRERLAFLTNEEGYSALWLKPLHGKARRLGNVPQGVMADLDWAPDGQSLSVTFTGPANPYDVWRYDLASSRFSQVTHSSLAGIDPKSFVSPTLVKYPSFDGRQIPAFWYAPKGAKPGAKLPTIVFVHGGPESQERPDFASSFQYYLNRGYALMALNIRGSIGYGKTFTHLDDVRKRMDAIADVDYATRWLKSTGWAAPNKLAVMGGSYGGYMTLACVTMLPDLWAAGVDTVGMSNLVSFLQNTGPWRRPLREAEYGSLTKDRDFLASVSPINHVSKIKAPLMVIQGANDPRVPKTEADQITATLKARKHPVEYLLFDDEGHGVAKLKNRIVSFTKTAEFLDKYVKDRK
ncbi:MAG: peptidase prolyl oligopeptidase active site domain protein [Cyanobacteria bacterium RYN_339]|nr:peptidase prolyl oligopeptidase active site domain protein [Cyanobacteria bacterium RYN_339]